MLNKQRMTEN